MTNNDNYLMLNGKKVELTEEQIRKLGLKENESIFDKVDSEKKYFIITENARIGTETMGHFPFDDKRKYLIANYCTDKEVLTKRAKEEVLNRLLWRFTMENGWEDERWTDSGGFWIIVEEHCIPSYRPRYRTVNLTFRTYSGMVAFVSKEIAQRAIDEIVIPFEKRELEVCKIWED